MSMFINRVRKNHAHLRKWAKRESCEAYRVYDRDIPEWPFAVDVYGGALVVYEYLRPRGPRATFNAEEAEESDAAADAVAAAEFGDRDADNGGPETTGVLKALRGSVGNADAHSDMDADAVAGADARLEEAVSGLSALFSLPRDEIFVKFRQRQKGLLQYEKLGSSQGRRVIAEGGLKFIVNLTDYLDTGLFLDHRKTRALVRGLVGGKHVLNLFCYTGSVSAYAAAGQAASVTSVDLSNTYLSWARENFEINGLRGGRYDFVRADVLQFLRDAKREEIQFDFIFVDPPSFSNSKKMEGVFDVQEDHVALLRDCLDLLTPDGMVLFSNNRRKFRLSEDAFTDARVTDISLKTIPDDFRNKKIHRAWILSR